MHSHFLCMHTCNFAGVSWKQDFLFVIHHLWFLPPLTLWPQNLERWVWYRCPVKGWLFCSHLFSEHEQVVARYVNCPLLQNVASLMRAGHSPEDGLTPTIMWTAEIALNFFKRGHTVEVNVIKIHCMKFSHNEYTEQDKIKLLDLWWLPQGEGCICKWADRTELWETGIPSLWCFYDIVSSSRDERFTF